MFKKARAAVVSSCLLSLVALSARADVPAPSDTPTATRTPFTLTVGEQGTTALVVPPSKASTEKAPMVLMLHGMCDVPENECPSFAGSATAGSFVVCPRADLACTGGGSIWNGKPEVRSRIVNDVLAKTNETLAVDPARRTLVGFSLGAFVALDVAQRQKGEFKNLVLIGARVLPDAKKLKESGIERVLLASGRHDMTRDHMTNLAKKLEAEGIKATYKTLGPVGHQFAPDMNAWLKEAFVWLEG